MNYGSTGAASVPLCTGGNHTLASYQYDMLSRRTQALNGNAGTSGIEYAYGDDNDLIGMRHMFGAEQKTFAHDYNAAGQLSASYASDGNWQWSTGGNKLIDYDSHNERDELGQITRQYGMRSFHQKPCTGT